MSYTRGDFSHFDYGAIINHEQNLINITTQFYKINSFNDVGTDAFTTIIEEISACKNFLPFPAKESRLSDRESKLQAMFNKYFEQYPSINRDDASKKSLLGIVERFFRQEKSKKEMTEAREHAQKRTERRVNDAVSGLLLLSKGDAPFQGGYKRKTSKKHRKRHSSRKKHRKRRTRRH